jgi:hypothetical protein
MGAQTGFAMRLAIAAGCLFAVGTAHSAGRPADYEITTGLYCDTAQQAERFVALFDGKDAATAVNAVNVEEHNSAACGVATLAFIRGNRAASAHVRDSAYEIVHILVLAIETKDGLRPVRPAAFYTVFSVTEYRV